MAEELTPMLRQYRAMRQELDGDALLLFRLGDFYELFMDDARRAAPLLGLALTHRAGQPMCGIPHHAIDAYLAKIVRAGLKAAICDQMEDPRSVKGGRMVRREITRIVTPGTVTEETLLAEDADNYLVAVVPEPAKGAQGFVVGVLELSTGELFCEAPADRAELSACLARLALQRVNERKVRRAPSYVANEDLVPRLNFAAPVPFIAGKPRVKRRLRLLHKRNARQTRLLRRKKRQFARRFVEGRRDGDDDRLRLERIRRELVIPRGSEMREIVRRDLDRGPFRRFLAFRAE